MGPNQARPRPLRPSARTRPPAIPAAAPSRAPAPPRSDPVDPAARAPARPACPACVSHFAANGPACCGVTQSIGGIPLVPPALTAPIIPRDFAQPSPTPARVALPLAPPRPVAPVRAVDGPMMSPVGNLSPHAVPPELENSPYLLRFGGPALAHAAAAATPVSSLPQPTTPVRPAHASASLPSLSSFIGRPPDPDFVALPAPPAPAPQSLCVAALSPPRRACLLQARSPFLATSPTPPVCLPRPRYPWPHAECAQVQPSTRPCGASVNARPYALMAGTSPAVPLSASRRESRSGSAAEPAAMVVMATPKLGTSCGCSSSTAPSHSSWVRQGARLAVLRAPDPCSPYPAQPRAPA
ncbi:MAG: hypothetical protein FD189_2578 [Elusimicrobia bacterium]|nr:MAG: hypothetical protein FD189_2578 [Elusimicrobiota bacterium]